MRPGTIGQCTVFATTRQMNNFHLRCLSLRERVVHLAGKTAAGARAGKRVCEFTREPVKELAPCRLLRAMMLRLPIDAEALPRTPGTGCPSFRPAQLRQTARAVLFPERSTHNEEENGSMHAVVAQRSIAEIRCQKAAIDRTSFAGGQATSSNGLREARPAWQWTGTCRRGRDPCPSCSATG